MQITIIELVVTVYVAKYKTTFLLTVDYFLSTAVCILRNVNIDLFFFFIPSFVHGIVVSRAIS